MSKAKTVAFVTSTVAISIALIAGLVLFVHDKSKAPSPSASTGVTRTVPDLDRLAELINQDRAANNLAPLTRDANLDASAKDKCNDMVAKKYWDHTAPDGTAWYTFIDAHETGTRLGENLSARGQTADDVNTAWMHSPGHRANILQPAFNNVGYAKCDVPSYPNAVVQHFAAKN